MADPGDPAGPSRHPRLAADPMPYLSRDGEIDRSPQVLEEAFADLARIGFTAVPADLPDGMTAAQYARWIGSFGLAPALSVFSSAFDETVDITDEMERAKRFAADQVSLGLDRVMISSAAVPARMLTPAVGADFHDDRLALAVENCGIVCEVLQTEGLRPLHLPHVGGVFETEREISRLLDTLGSNVIGFGPDIGHLCWAGADPIALIGRYADRIGGLRLKDCFADYLDPASREGMSYREVLHTKRLWAEPGRGVVDWAGVLAALPPDYHGDYVIDVDEPSGDSLYESFQTSFTWACQSLVRGAARSSTAHRSSWGQV